MIRRFSEMVPQERENIRGGVGKGAVSDYLRPGEMAGVLASSRVTLAPGASIGAHPHLHEDEFYLVLGGQGFGVLDEESFPVGPGDAFLCRAGHAHGLVNPGPGPLSFFAVLTRAAE